MSAGAAALPPSHLKPDSRQAIFVLVVLMHALVIGLLIRQRGQARVPASGAVFEVSLIDAPRNEPDVPPPVKPIPMQLAIVVPVPEVQITTAVESPVMAVLPEQPPAVAPVISTPVETPRMVTQADYLRAPPPKYPASANQARQQGITMVLVWVDAQGKPTRVELETSSGFPVLDRTAVNAVREWLFRPFVESGHARAVQVLVPVEFSLTQRVARR